MTSVNVKRLQRRTWYGTSDMSMGGYKIDLASLPVISGSHAKPPRYVYRFKLTPVVALLGRLIS